MKLAGWTYIEGCIPWTKAFDVEVSYNKNFSLVPAEDVEKMLIHCDLYGFVRDARGIPYEFTNMLDRLFQVYGIDIKENFIDRSNVVYNGKFVRCIDDVYNTPLTQKEVNAVDVNLTIIDGRYVYFNCTTCAFYDPINEFVRKNLGAGCGNLGGWLVKIGEYKEIDSLLKDINQYG